MDLDISSTHTEKESLLSKKPVQEALPESQSELVPESRPVLLPEPQSAPLLKTRSMIFSEPVLAVEPVPEPAMEAVHEPVRPLPPSVADVRPIPALFRENGIRVDDAVFVNISPGTFIMGSPEDEPGRQNDETQHEVTITREFCLQATPVTQGQWKSVMGANPSNFMKGGLDCPVEGVSWNDCQEFIRKLNQKGEYGYRLPTEAEWEYACRAGTSSAFSDGEIARKRFSRKDPCLNEIGWYSANSGGKTHPVADKKPNAWGLSDMHGNVCEWCQDWYGKYPLMPQRDPQGPVIGPGCVVRGGSWSSASQDCRSAGRLYHSPNSRSKFVGFRLVREPKK